MAGKNKVSVRIAGMSTQFVAMNLPSICRRWHYMSIKRPLKLCVPIPL